jgi:hypothetical protein
MPVDNSVNKNSTEKGLPVLSLFEDKNIYVYYPLETCRALKQVPVDNSVNKNSTEKGLPVLS